MREIPLTQGQRAMVDDEDYPELSRFKWLASKKDSGFYAVRILPRGQAPRSIYMHRYLMGSPVGFEIDHKDRNPLNNQKSNLRVVTHRENQCNQAKQKGECSSDFIGVVLDKKNNKWISQIKSEGKNIRIGRFVSEIAAAYFRNEVAKELHGDLACLNVLPAFLDRWVEYGMHLVNRAEALGVDWEHCSMEELTSQIILAEEFATPDEYREGNNIQKSRTR